MKTPVPQASGNEKEGYYITVNDGAKIFIWEYVPKDENKNTIYIISGITGINHKNEEEIIALLSNNENRVAVIHPRGTGYSEGARGDTNPWAIINDYCEIIKGDSSYSATDKNVFLFSHSMSCAFALQIARKLPSIHGLIMINPPFKLRPAKGMSPELMDYLKYIAYYLFAPHTPVVNMAGDPSIIVNESDRLESEQRNNDPLLVKYFSVNCMAESKKIIDAMVKNSRQADFPLLLLYGENDNIVDKSGCDEIFAEWKNKNKSYVIIKGGSHGKSTVLQGAEIISKWFENL